MPIITVIFLDRRETNTISGCIAQEHADISQRGRQVLLPAAVTCTHSSRKCYRRLRKACEITRKLIPSDRLTNQLAIDSFERNDAKLRTRRENPMQIVRKAGILDPTRQTFKHAH